MPSVQLDLTWTLFAVFCGYSLYTSFVSFMWDEKGRRVFQNLRIPVVVFIYFLIPCVALFLANKAYDGVREWAWMFVMANCFILSISFIVMLYILTVPDWPIGKFLQIDRVPVSYIRALVSVNAVGSLLIATLCGAIVVEAPRAIQQQGNGAIVNKLEAQSKQLEQEKIKSNDKISGARLTAIRQVIDEYVKPVNEIGALLTSGAGLVVSLRALSGKKRARKAKGKG